MSAFNAPSFCNSFWCSLKMSLISPTELIKHSLVSLSSCILATTEPSSLASTAFTSSRNLLTFLLITFLSSLSFDVICSSLSPSDNRLAGGLYLPAFSNFLTNSLGRLLKRSPCLISFMCPSNAL